LLAQAEDAPAFLTVRGNVQLLGQRAIAVVGARNASANGQHLAETLARDLGAAGLLVVSGLARGIDAAAHRGALVTEARPSEQPTARHFPRRNRIIAGIAEGVVVVEAAPRSGSLITARLAGEYGRDVFAVPDAAHDPRGRGTNQLLREGAILTETADDVLAALLRRIERRHVLAPVPAVGPAANETVPLLYEDDRPDDADGHADGPLHAVNSALGTSPTLIDDVVRQTGIPSDAVLSVFTDLELERRLKRHPGDRVALRATG
jgi:DNA processing protein